MLLTLVSWCPSLPSLRAAIHAYTHEYIRAYMHTCTHAHTHTSAHTRMHVCLYTFILTKKHKQTYAYIINTYTQTRTDASMHTCISTSKMCENSVYNQCWFPTLLPSLEQS